MMLMVLNIIFVGNDYDFDIVGYNWVGYFCDLVVVFDDNGKVDFILVLSLFGIRKLKV